jgi:hypothetical protein
LPDQPPTVPPARISVLAGPLAAPVLSRVVGMLAARADLPVNRLDDAVLVADTLADVAPRHLQGDELGVEVQGTEKALALRVGPLVADGGRGLLEAAAVPGLGNVVERLADEVWTEDADGAQFLCLRLHARAG